MGNLTRYTDRRGRVIEYDYDALNRIVEERWMDGEAPLRMLSFEWDAASQLTAASDPDSAYQFTYDDAGRLITVSNDGTPGVPTVVLAMAYDRLHRRTSVAATINGQYVRLSSLTQSVPSGVQGQPGKADVRKSKAIVTRKCEEPNGHKPGQPGKADVRAYVTVHPGHS